MHQHTGVAEKIDLQEVGVGGMWIVCDEEI
jgi:hypothetical protein